MTRPRATTMDRWRLLAIELRQTIEQIERGDLDREQAEQRVGELCRREAMALDPRRVPRKRRRVLCST